MTPTDPALRASPDELSNVVIGCAITLHRRIGPGLFESVYEALLARALQQFNLKVERMVSVPLFFDGIQFDEAYRIDLLIERTLVVEIKSSQKNIPLYSKQVLTYLRLLNQPLGLVLNFGRDTLKEGIERVANDYRATPLPNPSPLPPSPAPWPPPPPPAS
ncbi:MAG: GxxExxY protein [Gemmatimonas sp.]